MERGAPSPWWYGVPVLAWVVGCALARSAGFWMRIPWDYYQVLDRAWLAAHPVASLCYLHSQPPGLNALLAVALATADVTGASPATVGRAMFMGFELIELLAVFHLVLRLASSRALASLAVVLILADPGHHVFSHLFFYEIPVATLLAVLLVMAHAYLRDGGLARLAGVAAAVVAIASLRTLFHPMWALGLVVLLVTLRAASAPEERGLAVRRAVPLLIALLVALSMWPLKNAVVFGRFLGASMSAYSFSREVPGCQPGRQLARVPSTEIAQVEARAGRWCGEGARDVLLAPRKRDGAANWNHVTRLVVAPHLARCAVAWRSQHPGAWLARALGQYAMWTRPTFVHPYETKITGPPGAAYRRYAERYAAWLFLDLRPWLERPTNGWFPHDAAMVRGAPVPYTLFGVVVLPALVVTVLARLARPWTPAHATAVVALVCLLWPMLGACLSDGQEGNRMRVSSEAVLVVLAVWAFTPPGARVGPEARQPRRPVRGAPIG